MGKTRKVQQNSLIKPVATWQYFYKILQSPNIILTPILQNPNVILAPILQSPNAILAPILQSPNTILALILQNPNIILVKTITLCSKAQNYFLTKKSLTHGKYKLLISQKYFFTKLMRTIIIFSIIN